MNKYLTTLSRSQLWSLVKEYNLQGERTYQEMTTEDMRELLAPVLKDAWETVDIAEQEYQAQDVKVKYDVLAPEKPALITEFTPDGNPIIARTEHGEPIIRADEDGTVWLQQEIMRPLVSGPRAVRRIKYVGNDTETHRVDLGNGEFETIERPGANTKIMEATVVLPLSQVGIFRSPSHPFKVYKYGGQMGYDLNEVRDYYGGALNLPSTITSAKNGGKVYVDNRLCYSINVVAQAIRKEYETIILNQRTAI